jgi:HD-GYP domain-containing protein (c-di-GMP phosphodiesterase class II)
VLINDLSVYTPLSFLAPRAKRLLAVPLQRQEQLFGCLFCFDKLDDDFNSIDAKLLVSIANETTIYLENSVLFADVQQLVLGLMHSLTAAVDAKDPYTHGHSERVALLSKLTAERAGFDKAFCERVYISGLLHDVGKIGVPEAVLSKAGKLTDEEFEKIKLHPEIGARILGDVKQIQDVIPGVLHHHERYDGRGYPHKLAGEAIPLMGRIICLADCFDAMTSSRTYRKALPLEVALTEIRKNAGAQFDPKLTEAFLAIGDEQLREIAKSSESVVLTPAMPEAKVA